MANNVPAPSLSPPSDKVSPLLPSPSPSPPSSPTFTLVELDVPPHEPNEQMEPQPKRPRGRPPGSKNKPKPAMKEREEFPKLVVLNISAGKDIVNAIIEFARTRDVSIVVHDASGALSEATLNNDGSHDLSLRGNLQMLTLSGFYTKCLSPSPPKNIPYSYFSIQLVRGSPPQLFGGFVRDKLIAAEPIQVTAFLVKKHDYYMPNVQPVFMGDSLNGITNNAVGPSGIYPMKFLAAPTDLV